MIAKLIGHSIHNRLLVLMSTLAIVAAGFLAIANIPIDAIPDLSDVQVIVFTEYSGQSPQVIEEQVTYPLTSAMLSVPRSKVVRGYSFFGFSLVYVIFQDGTDIYWARSRVLEYLNFAASRLPRGVKPQLGPDATGVGWVYMYTISDPTGKLNLQQLRSIQDWQLRYDLASLKGVAEVASLGGFVKQYQVEVDPTKLLLYNIHIGQVRKAIARSNTDSGGRLVEMGEAEYMIRGLGYIKSIQDIRSIVLRTSPNGNPVTVGDVANVQIGPEIRRGLADWNGEGEAVVGIIVARFGENALEVIERVKERLEQLKPGLPKGVVITPAYDRSHLILRAVKNIAQKLGEEMLVVALITMLFLAHVRSALVAVVVIPVGILASLFIMYLLNINANIMSLGGIAIAIGVMVDSSIVMVENLHKHMEERPNLPHAEIVRQAAVEVGPALFYSLLIITISFLPVLLLEEQAGRLFRPLALTKTFAMAFAALTAVTIIPVLMSIFVKGDIKPEHESKLSRFFIRYYRPIIDHALDHKRLWMGGILAAIVATMIPLFGIPGPGGQKLVPRLGGEFMPPLNEGDILYMPTTLPGLSISKAREVLQQTDRIIKKFPEVKSVLGKIGRAETATDPAPLNMVETTIVLKDKSKWRSGMTTEKLMREMDRAIQFPGLTNAWTYPIRTRIDMLSTGIKTPVGVKLLGPDLSVLADYASQLEAVLKKVPGTATVIADRVTGGRYVDFEIDRKEAARYGLTVGAIQQTIMTAIGGMNVTETVEGLARYPVNVRYPRELRDHLEALKNVWVSTPQGAHIPLSQVARVLVRMGPPGIKTENARLTAWLFVDLKEGQDVSTYVEAARKIVARQIQAGKLKHPKGVTLVWSGQYEQIEQANRRMLLAAGGALLAIIFILYLHFRNFTGIMILLGCLPFAVTGGIWLLYVLGYNRSVATDVGFIALAGLSVETGIVLLVYLDVIFKKRLQQGRLLTHEDVRAGVIEGVVGRVRPKLMTTMTTLIGLTPILWATDAGSRIMKRLAMPMIGGLVTDTLVTLVIIPIVYETIQRHRLAQGTAGPLDSHLGEDEQESQTTAPAPLLAADPEPLQEKTQTTVPVKKPARTPTTKKSPRGRKKK